MKNMVQDISFLCQKGVLITGFFLPGALNTENTVFFSSGIKRTTKLWSGTNKKTDWSTGPLARPFARSLVPLIRSLAAHYLLRSRARSLTLLTPSLVGQRMIGWLFCLCFFLFSTIVQKGFISRWSDPDNASWFGCLVRSFSMQPYSSGKKWVTVVSSFKHTTSRVTLIRPSVYQSFVARLANVMNGASCFSFQFRVNMLLAWIKNSKLSGWNPLYHLNIDGRRQVSRATSTQVTTTTTTKVTHLEGFWKLVLLLGNIANLTTRFLLFLSDFLRQHLQISRQPSIE